MGDEHDDYEDEYDDRPRRGGGGFFKWCLICGCLLLVLAGLGAAGAVYYMRQFVMLDPARVEANLREMVECQVPSGYQGMFGMKVPGAMAMAVIAPAGLMMGQQNQSAPPLMIIAMTAQGLNAAQMQQQAQQSMQQQLQQGNMTVESEQTIRLTIRGQPVDAQERIGNQNGQRVRTVMVLFPRSTQPNETQSVFVMFMGRVEGFDQAAMDAFLGSIR